MGIGLRWAQVSSDSRTSTLGEVVHVQVGTVSIGCIFAMFVIP